MNLEFTVLFRRGVARAVILMVLAYAGLAAAQTPPLGDVARREAERRKAQPSGAKVYTNKDMPESVRPLPDAAADAGSQDPARSGSAAQKGESGTAAAGLAQENTRGEAWWRARITKARDEVRRNEQLADALQSRINALTRDFTSRDNPVQRAQVGEDRAAALTELARVQQEIEHGRQRIDAIEDEARRAGVPPGWLR